MTPRRYGAGHVSELLRAHGKKLDDEQVGRGLNEVCAECNGGWGWMRTRGGRRIPSRLIRGTERVPAGESKSGKSKKKSRRGASTISARKGRRKPTNASQSCVS